MNYWERTDRSLIVQANAGTGKTTVLVHCLQRTAAPSLALAFMKKAAEEIQDRLGPGSPHKAMTLNSAGFALLKEFWDAENIAYKTRRVDAEKYEKLIGALMPNAEYSDIKNVTDAVNLVRANLIDPNDWDGIDRICSGMYVPMQQEYFPVVEAALTDGLSAALNGLVDFEDQIWVPVRMGLIPQYRYECVFIDEVQDLTHSKRKLAGVFLEPGGKVFAAGDRFQAIQGWAGAASNSFDLVKQEFACDEMRLTQSFRFGPKIAELSKSIVPDLQGVGKTDDIIRREPKLPQRFPDSSIAIISRFNYPLIALAIEYFKRNTPVRLKKTDLLEDMGKKAFAISKIDGFEWSRFRHFALAYVDIKAKWAAEHNVKTSYIAKVKETIDCLIMAYERLEPRDLKDFQTKLEAVFKTNDGPLLITAHSAKGMQFKTVYLLQPETFEAEDTKYRNQDELDQALFTQYVAFTRGMNELVFVSEPEVA